MKRFLLLFLVMPAGGQVVQAPVKQDPSLVETFDWMTNTLKPTEGNNAVIHRPFKRPYPKDWEDKGMDPYHSEVITNFSSRGLPRQLRGGCHEQRHGAVVGQIPS